MIVGLDTFDYTNFPVYVQAGQSVRKILEDILRGGNSYDEVYDYSLDKNFQFQERRAMHLPNE